MPDGGGESKSWAAGTGCAADGTAQWRDDYTRDNRRPSRSNGAVMTERGPNKNQAGFKHTRGTSTLRLVSPPEPMEGLTDRLKNSDENRSDDKVVDNHKAPGAVDAVRPR